LQALQHALGRRRQQLAAFKDLLLQGFAVGPSKALMSTSNAPTIRATATTLRSKDVEARLRGQIDPTKTIRLTCQGQDPFPVTQHAGQRRFRQRWLIVFFADMRDDEIL
jgi:hypothetical protein